VAPLIGSVLLGYLFVKALIDFRDPESAYTTDGLELLGFQLPAIIGLGFLLLGFVLLVIWRLGGHESFFNRRRFEAVDPDIAAGRAAPPPETAGAPAGG
jgi:hypothetical protein